MEDRHYKFMELAEQAKNRAYAPYSHYRVGACVVDENGKTAIGCNVENASYGATLCAERNAVAAAVTAGLSKIVAVYIACDATEPAMPCGVCRQVLFECNPDMMVYAFGSDRAVYAHSLSELLPYSFGPQNLK